MEARKVTGVFVPVDGMPEVIEFDHSLENMQTLVGGYLDVVRLPGNIDCWINDEGLINGMPFNLAIGVAGRGVFELHGPLLFLTSDSDGETVSLSEAQLISVLARIGVAKAMNHAHTEVRTATQPKAVA